MVQVHERGPVGEYSGHLAGVIVAALLAADYSAAEMKQIVKELDYNSFRDASLLDRVPMAGQVTQGGSGRTFFRGLL